MTTKESLKIDLDNMTASCKNGVIKKYARKVIQDELKQTDYKGGWTVWFEYDDGERYHFTLTNPYKFIDKLFNITKENR